MQVVLEYRYGSTPRTFERYPCISHRGARRCLWGVYLRSRNKDRVPKLTPRIALRTLRGPARGSATARPVGWERFSRTKRCSFWRSSEPPLASIAESYPVRNMSQRSVLCVPVYLAVHIRLLGVFAGFTPQPTGDTLKPAMCPQCNSLIERLAEAIQSFYESNQASKDAVESVLSDYCRHKRECGRTLPIGKPRMPGSLPARR